MHNIANRWMLRGGHQPGLIGDGHCVMDPQRRITVATFASLVAGVRNKEQWAALVLGDCEGLIVDEAHTLPADTFFKIAMATRRAYFRLGFSATPLARSDKRSLCAVGALGPVIFSVDARKLIADGVIARPVIRMVRHTEDTTAKTFAGVYSAVVARSKHRNNLLIKIARIAEKPALLFVKHVAHGKYLTKLLNQLGIQAGFVDGTKETEQRERTIKKLEAGDIDVLVVSNWAQDGTDIPTLRSVINGAAGLSAIATIQRIGRGSRIDKASGKDEFEVWDIFDDGMRASTEQYPVPKPHALSRHAKARKKAYEKEGHSVELIDIDDLSKLEASRGTK